ncbi:2-oxoacid:acceptor oxidoreductase family protein [bacterium]|nr:2-oxoacid:acceptor oxidoreductase family protein [bacterium]MBU1428854.1 2-oxoacid:acceptor oxidoreductase family protein [bacterium]
MENNFYLIGVGGQGVIRLGQIITEYGLKKGEKVKFFKEVGMAQRGGPVHCEVRIGNVFGSRIPPLSSDIIVVMELSEGLKSLEFVKPGGTVILNRKRIYPIDMMAHPEKYPKNEEITRLFKEARAKVIWIDAGEIASEVGLPITENVVLLGTLSFISSFDKEFVINILKKHIPRELEKNIAAFCAGYKTAEGMDK